MSSKKAWIIPLSIGAHVTIFTVAYVTNAWRLDRLDVEKASISLAVMMPPPAPAGGPAPGQKPKDPTPPPKKIAQEPTQPVAAIKKDEPKPTSDDSTGGGIGDKKGPGTNPDGEITDTGSCVGPACGPPSKEPVKEEPKKEELVKTVTMVPPQILKGNRISGETMIAPPDVVKTQMMRDDHKRTVGAFKICLSESGQVSSVTMIASTKYPAYDALLMSTMRTWLYHPYMIGGQPAPVCSAVSFVYSMQ
jgi:hypothetical protein